MPAFFALNLKQYSRTLNSPNSSTPGTYTQAFQAIIQSCTDISDISALIYSDATLKYLAL